MLAQNEADGLIAMQKLLVERTPIAFPMATDELQIEAKSVNGRESFNFDVNRKGRLKLTKCTYQNRYAVVEILLRLDIDGPPHENPDGHVVPCPHLHVYREGYGDKWAIPAPPAFSDTADLVDTLRHFLQYANVVDIPPIQRSLN